MTNVLINKLIHCMCVYACVFHLKVSSSTVIFFSRKVLGFLFRDRPEESTSEEISEFGR